MSLKKKTAPHIVKIISKLQRSGYETYLVGGAIRDILLGRPPKDYDISTSARPEQVRKVFGRRRAKIIGKRFRIVHLYHGREVIEISTFRTNPTDEKKLKSDNNSKALLLTHDNRYGTAYEDSQRRDFTINAIFYDPIKDSLIDFTEKGLNDLHNGVVRVIGNPDVRFSEDPVRVLRALKTVGQYNFKLEKQTEESLRNSLELINMCSRSRLTLELEKIIHRSYSEKVFRVFHEYGFLTHFLPTFDQKWESEECKNSMQLLGEHNKRLQNDECPGNLSCGFGIMAIPFINKYISDEYSGRWEYYSGIDKDIYDIIDDLFHPHKIPKYIVSSMVSAILLQPRLFKKKQLQKTKQHPHFRTAREIMIAQNNTWWKDSELNNFWARKPREQDDNVKDTQQ